MNCSSWCEKKSDMKAFLKGYSGSKDILSLEEWPLPNKFKELLPRHYADAIKCLTLKNYTHPLAGVVNVPDEPRPVVDLGPMISVHYGPRGVHRRSNSITKLKCTFSDRVLLRTNTLHTVSSLIYLCVS